MPKCHLCVYEAEGSRASESLRFMGILGLLDALRLRLWGLMVWGLGLCAFKDLPRKPYIA